MNAFSSPRDRAQLLLVALGLAIAIALAPFAAGLLGALVLYVAVAPAYRRLLAFMPRRASAIVVVTATAVLILLPLAWLLVIAIGQAPAALRQLQASDGLARLAAVRIGSADIGTRIVAAGGELVSWASAQAFRALGGAVRGTLNMVVALFGLYFLLLSSADAWRAVAAYLPFSAAGADLLRDRFRHVTEATLLGTALTAVLQGIVVALGFAATGLPDALFWGVVTAVVSVFPVLGSAVVWLPGAVALAIQGRYGASVALVALGAIVASNIDNVMRPLVNRRVSNLHPMTTLVGAFAGVGVLGLPGILLGPLAITYFFELVRLYRREYGEATEIASASPVAPPPSFELTRRDAVTEPNDPRGARPM
jgi:predicted PurR-regulated permease PerM